MTADLNALPDHPIRVLVQYQADHGVTFAALDNDALAAVREAYAGEYGIQALTDLRDAVGALLGLDD